MPTTKTKAAEPKAGHPKAGNPARSPPAKQPRPAGRMTDSMTDAEEEAFFQGIADDMTEAAQAAIAENDRLGIPSVSPRRSTSKPKKRDDQT